MKGFRWTRMKPEMLGRDSRDWRAYIQVSAPKIRDLMEIVSLGDKYILSVGGHLTHGILLMDKACPEPLTVERCLSCCALLAFATDSPVVPIIHTGHFSAGNSRQVSTSLRGTVFSTVKQYGDMLGDLAAAADVYAQTGVTDPFNLGRVLMPRSPTRGFWAFYPWPTSASIERGLAAYWMATLSVLAPSRILNFWRAMEGVTTPQVREALFTDLHSRRTAAVWTQVTRLRKGPDFRYRLVDGCRALRRIAVRRRDELLGLHGTAKAAMDHIYWEGRGKAAHADRKSLEYDMAAFIGDQLRDAELLRFMARVAIEEAW